VTALAAAAAHDRLGAILAPAAVNVDRAQAEAFQAPEGVWNSGADRVRVDVFALGALAYFVLAGRPPAPDRAEGYVEPVVAPSRPLHLLAQQLLALWLQHGRVGRQTRTRRSTLLELRTSGGGLECLHMGAGLHEWWALARSAA